MSIKKRFSILFIILLILLISGCSENPDDTVTPTPEAFTNAFEIDCLGMTESELTFQKGEGFLTQVDTDGLIVTVSSAYSQTVLNTEAESIFIFGNYGLVSSIAHNFKSSYATMIPLINKELGADGTSSKTSDGAYDKMVWQIGDYLYYMADYKTDVCSLYVEKPGK